MKAININSFNFNPNDKRSVVSWHSDSKIFVAYGSDLIWNFDMNKLIKLKNTVTNGVIEFKLKTVKKDSDGDTQVWILSSVSGAKFPCELHILND